MVDWVLQPLICLSASTVHTYLYCAFHFYHQSDDRTRGRWGNQAHGSSKICHLWSQRLRVRSFLSQMLCLQSVPRSSPQDESRRQGKLTGGFIIRTLPHLRMQERWGVPAGGLVLYFAVTGWWEPLSLGLVVSWGQARGMWHCEGRGMWRRERRGMWHLGHRGMWQHEGRGMWRYEGWRHEGRGWLTSVAGSRWFLLQTLLRAI